MKIKSLLIGMLASTAFVACTNDESPVNDTQAVVNGEKQYVAVNIVTPGSVGSRAAGDFQTGSEDEVKVNQAVFLFLDKDLNGCATPYYTTEIPNFIDLKDEGVDKKATLLVIDNAKEVPTYMVAVLNPVNQNYTADTDLADLKAEHATYTTYTNNNFVMSNAVYRAANGKEVAATPITMDNIFSYSDDAMSNPVTIQVERVVGKVNVELGTAAANWDMDDEQLDDIETKELELVITGWDVLQNVESKLVKNINLSWNHTWWNDVNLKRSYWAVDYTDAKRNALLVDKMNIPESGFRYVEETVSQVANTVEADDVNPYLVVAAKFVDATTKEDVSLVEWRGRKYTAQGYLNFIAGNSMISQYWYKVAEGQYSQFSAGLLELVDDKITDWKASAQLTTTAAAYEYYTCDYNADGTPVQNSWTKVVAEEGKDHPVVAAVKEFGDVQYWNGCRTYYYTPIKHQTVGTDNFYGVVRNHVYNVKVTGISGYGTPVSNPEQAIEIPEKPVGDKSYLAAEIVILDWKVVNQEVTLQ